MLSDRAMRVARQCEVLSMALNRTVDQVTHGAPINALEELGEAHKDLADATLNAVRLAREQGHSWAVIGEALGVTRQAAAQRFSG